MNIFRVSLITFIVIIHSPGPGSGTDCKVKNTCKDCIGTNGCAWCSKVNGSKLLAGCFAKEEIKNVCKNENIEDPVSKVFIWEDKPLRGSLNVDPIQIRPQNVALKLRTGETATIDIEFRKAEDYPIDLYYLMDFSSSMAKYKRSLSELGDKLTETMMNVTSNFQLGFGSFVDKVTLPYTDVIPSHLESPCSKCRSPYSFKNHMALNRQTKKFAKEVRKARMSGNNDTPEGTLEAILQAIVCKKQINWREKARHILVVSTDAPFHLAGDGKLGGIVEPHDGKCYVDENGDYTRSLDFDYPSISQIHQKAYENNVNIIFAVIHRVKEEYTALSQAIHGASVGLLDRGENIAEIIRSHYEKISTTIQLMDNAKGSVHVGYSALCPDHKARADETWFDTNECTKVRGGETVRFQAHITAIKCMDEESNNQNITIKPVGINENVTVQLKIICGCDCENESHMLSGECSWKGELVCGQCICNEGHAGETCECGWNNIASTESCIAQNLTNQICSGRGECVCGICQCQERDNPNEQITGQYCECDNYSCEKTDGLICSGHGTCDCKQCSCHPGWTGPSCNCPLDEQLCLADKGEEICSGRGKCECGICFCNNATRVDENRYTGKYCQICMTCGKQCEVYNDCVECLTYNSGIYSKEECKKCKKVFDYFNFTEDAKGLNDNLTSSNLCISVDEFGCSIRYVYYYDYEDLMVWSEKNKICPKEINIFAIISGTTGGTVLAGILLILIWKLLTIIHDKREYEKFEKERALARWGRGENPLYKTAIKTYKNPTYQQYENCR